MELLKKQLSEKVVFHYQKRLYFDYLPTGFFEKMVPLSEGHHLHYSGN